MPITINESTTFFISDESGDVPEGEANGLFAEDTRFLSCYLLRLDGQPLITLAAHQADFRTAEHFLTNPELPHVPVNTLGIVRRRTLNTGMRDELTIHNFGDREVSCTLELYIDVDFAGIFDVKRSTRVDKDAIRRLGSFTGAAEENGSVIRFSYVRDGLYRELLLRLSLPIAIAPGRCRAELVLSPRETWHLTLDFTTDTTRQTGTTRPGVATKHPAPHHDQLPRPAAGDSAIARSFSPSPGPELQGAAPVLTTDSYILHRAYERSIHDFVALRLRGEKICRGNLVLAAGIPWYMALFGRDSLLASYQALPFDPDLAAGTLRALASLQGEVVDPERDEEPGKILHEHRFSSITGHQRGIPRFPYYGSIDATPLFLILLAAHLRLTQSLELARELWPNAIRALEWIERYGDLDGDGYLEYSGTSDGLSNQGWKDSWDSIRYRDGRIAMGPIALCEVQGYAYAARLGFAKVCEALGEHDRAAKLRTDARRLAERFNHDFWLPDRRFYALALDGDKRPVDSLTSNPGHLLWTGIADEDKAAAVAETLISPNFFSGWGIRTMAIGEGGYNPVSYHNGSVWPHDNSFILAGLTRYGFTNEATRIADGLVAALGHSPDHRLPELFAGYGRDEAHAPVQYPTACRPQAWASGSVLLAIAAATGIELDGGSATAEHFPYEPFLPTDADELRLDGLHVGGSRVTIQLRRDRDRITREVDRRDGTETAAA